MEKNTNIISYSDFVPKVKHIIADRIGNVLSPCGYNLNVEALVSGKLLRTRMAAYLAESITSLSNIETLVYACAATEIVHTASLCHDDVIDGGIFRRGLPALWKCSGISSAILIGDLLLCEAIDLLSKTSGSRYISSFVSKVREVCRAEIEQEVLLRGERIKPETCLKLARGKTGAFFAFIGLVCGGDNTALSSALEEAGYYIGTAYQLADDLHDIVGDEYLSGKTLGSDSLRGKYTLPQCSETPQITVHNRVSELCLSAINCLNKWPRVRKGLEQFLSNDLQTAFNHMETRIRVSV